MCKPIDSTYALNISLGIGLANKLAHIKCIELYCKITSFLVTMSHQIILYICMLGSSMIVRILDISNHYLAITLNNYWFSNILYYA